MPPSPATIERLEQTWRWSRGFPSAMAEVNNQPLGKRFMFTAFLFFLAGGIMALLMRVQLAVSENTFLGPQVYNELFTMHGSTMMFLFAVPFLEGLALYLLPSMIGARDVAFPRMSAYSYWVYLFGGVIFYVSYVFHAVPDVGWFGYTPLSTERFTGMATDFWLLGLSLVEVAGLAAAVEIVVTILKFRAPGMSLARMPLFVWALLVVGMMILIAFSVLLTATVLLELDRTVGTHFFNVDRGGSNLLWQHLFWFFGHPEVYIMFLPAAGIVSMIVPVFAGRPIVGYTMIGMGIVVTGFVSFGLWVHHMFTAGLPALAQSFFTASSLMIAIASGVQVFSWIATLWGSRPPLHVPLLFVLGFLFLFVLGGLTGVMVAVVPFDVQVHDTYFIVAHFHYVLIGGVIFPIFAALYYWMPRITERTLSECWGRIAFWLLFLGFNATFFPMHVMGFFGLPRRVYTYSSELQLDGYNVLATGGAFAMGVGVFVFMIDFLYRALYGPVANENPWNADTLEWSLPIPTPPYSFHTFPIVQSRHPLWEVDGNEDEESNRLGQLQILLSGEPQAWRGTLVTDVMYAQPQAIQYLSGPTYVPLWAALSTVTVAGGILARGYTVAAVATIVLIVTLIVWLRPQRQVLEMLHHDDLGQRSGLTLFPSGSQSTAWWGTCGLIVIMASACGALFYSYFYLRLFSDPWPPNGLPLPNVMPPAVATVCLLLTAGAQSAVVHVYRRGKHTAAKILLGGSLLSGTGYVVLQTAQLPYHVFVPQTNAYGSLFYVVTASACFVVAVGMVLNLASQFRLWESDPAYRTTATLQLEITALFGWFAAAWGLAVFVTLVVSPYL